MTQLIDAPAVVGGVLSIKSQFAFSLQVFASIITASESYLPT